MASDPVASETAGPLVMPAAPKLPKPPKPARARADKQRRMTPAQLEWPLAWFPAYLEAQSQGRYDKFWPGFFRDWFEKFPPRKPTEDDPSNSESDNDSDNDGEDDVEEADNAKEADNNTGKQKCSANKLENKNKKKKKTELSEGLTSDQKKERKIIKKTMKATEAFSKLYYAERILPVVQLRSSTHEGVLITLISEVTKELYDNAIEANDAIVVNAVANYIAKAKKAMEVEDEEEAKECTPQEYQDSIDKLDNFFKEVADVVMKKTGLCTSIYTGGPIPKLGGNIRTTSYHKGFDALGNTFGQAHKDLKAMYITPFHKFLRNKFPAEVRATRSLWEKPASENPKEMMHDDVDAAPGSNLLNPKFIPSLPPISDSKTISTPSAFVKVVEVANTPALIIESDEAIDQQIDFNCNISPIPEPRPSPQAPSRSQKNAPSDSESSNTTSMLDPPASGEIPDQQSAFKVNQGVLSPCFQRTRGQASAPAVPSPPALHPKPKPASLGPDGVLDPWAVLGRKRPNIPVSLAPSTKPHVYPQSNIPLVISEPPPTSMNILRLHAAAEAEACAMAAMKASLEASKASIEIEVSKTSNGELGSPVLSSPPASPDEGIPLPTRSSPKSSATVPSPSHPLIMPDVPVVTNESQVAPTCGRPRTLTPAGKLLTEEAAKKETERQERERKKAAVKISGKIVKGRGPTVGKTQKNGKRKNK